MLHSLAFGAELCLVASRHRVALRPSIWREDCGVLLYNRVDIFAFDKRFYISTLHGFENHMELNIRQLRGSSSTERLGTL